MSKPGKHQTKKCNFKYRGMVDRKVISLQMFKRVLASSSLHTLSDISYSTGSWGTDESAVLQLVMARWSQGQTGACRLPRQGPSSGLWAIICPISEVKWSEVPGPWEELLLIFNFCRADYIPAFFMQNINKYFKVHFRTAKRRRCAPFKICFLMTLFQSQKTKSYATLGNGLNVR